MYFKLYGIVLSHPLPECQHCKNKIVKITNLLVSTVVRDSGNYNLIGHVGCCVCMVICLYLY